jgi:hypothetical protein
MKILADYHHHDLWESLELLFTDRFGWEFYRPMGMEWFDEGYWNLERAWHGDAIAKQYLEPWGSDVASQRYDPSHNRFQKLVTLEQARNLQPDLVIATVAHNHEGFRRFAQEVGAKFAIHLGNVRFSEIDMREDRWDLADFGLVTSVLPGPVPKPHVVYHQEFSLSDFRSSAPPRNDPFRISSFVQCFPENTRTYADFTQIATSTPEFDWRVYGAYGSCPTDQWAAGNLGKCADVADAMRASDVAWHAKQWSDGFGHVIHNWFAVGRPVFGFASYYADQLAGPLWVDGVTSYDLTHRSQDEVARLLRELLDDPDKHLRMSEAAAARFREVVNFDEDAEKVRALIEAHV